ncbi:MAG: hypothetical protein CVV64_16360 [Candidatus Wallbacteria bacterium HGW-Wallbacteria-1]|jgi:protein-S-isoprenylcysteine O-methyltransferase Ste14|uniref:Isoprenylcysteine carboxyl methyltransferase n=1 Tax=Candidatus Wallbacteria bacterium HGW-Wallbacteria-1 TaxID=2013854 RepID=A0A2N1PKZ1_9BACT|nr:MAG: hypothetical protein CVV64_16360 [Candidatus Wallbacteria bacterium HGW-Wallbacteria-1]
MSICESSVLARVFMVNDRLSPLRMGASLFALFPLIYSYDFYEHFYFYLTGKFLIVTATGQWALVILSIVSFILFWVPLTYRRKVNWGEYGLIGGFFISLFIEMYGVSLTVWLLYSAMAGVTASVPAQSVIPHYVVVFIHPQLGFGMDLAMAYGAVMIVAGVLLIACGWYRLYRNGSSGTIVTDGIYQWSRHPQYLGFNMVILGWIIGWPSLITVLFGPVLIWKYVRVAGIEEQELCLDNPDENGIYSSCSDKCRQFAPRWL